MEAPTLLVIGHETDPDVVPVQAGTLTSWAAERDVRVVPVAMRGTGSTGPLPDPAAVDAIAVLGSVQGAWDDAVPWLGAEIAYLRTAIAAGIPVLGICFGGQLLARVLGGRAEPASERRENGWQEVTTHAPEVVVPGPWMEFHFDTFTPPASSEVLAVSERCTQAFRQGAHLGVQFHPEITPAEFDLWVDRWTGTPLEERLPDLGIDPVALRAETVARAEESRAASRVLFDAFAARAGLRSESAA
ncbi:type 1 glutamine amidotransferase [Actinomycetospora cinnamomea]|uniref:GMP synthase-like glutamine amidotransferase n=1 Tax=Actinomycetospora cinnamomea TaxID=663609 RepID=A0A2U1F8D6_9PSEU|nr:type 1 glutamine amidotransferase [Actinomycetospora cinnamomea]PVZ08428.1 GMP synthase-like glutamine amidotransferase [Actinomycetospora cinnamomea]